MLTKLIDDIISRLLGAFGLFLFGMGLTIAVITVATKYATIVVIVTIAAIVATVLWRRARYWER